MASLSYAQVYERLEVAFGQLNWWPARTPFEVIVGAVLTQNTAWRNVERAIAALHAAGALNGPVMRALPPEELATLIRPAGYYRVKARRLAAVCDFLETHQALEDPRRLITRFESTRLRELWLGVHGVGEETADSILLYALGMPSFVVDAYTRRIFTRLGLLEAGLNYGQIQRIFMSHLPRDTMLFNEYHALIVQLGKECCRPRPRCPACPLRADCKHANA